MQITYDAYTGEPRAKLICARDAYDLLCKVADINHPNLMRIFRVTQYADRCEAVCEYINGVTLEQMILHEGLCSNYDARRIMVQVCDGLNALHEKGIIHRDIKPSNVMITSSGNVKIVDFDISRTFKENQSKDTRILGSVGYTSPEQFGFSQTDARADVYSCGVLLNFLLTGACPDERQVDGPLGKIISKCIEIDKTNRFDNILDLRKSLKRGHITRVSRFFPLPGYRGKSKFFKFMITFLLIIFVFFAAVDFDAWVINNDTYVANIGASPYAGLRAWFGLNIFVFLLPYLLFGDFAYLSEIICKKNPKIGKVILSLLAIASIFLGIFIAS